LVLPDDFDGGLFNGLTLLGEINRRRTPLLLAVFIKATTSNQKAKNNNVQKT